MSRADARLMNETTEERMRCERCNRRARVSSLQVVKDDTLSCWLCLTGNERGSILKSIHAFN